LRIADEDYPGRRAQRSLRSCKTGLVGRPREFPQLRPIPDRPSAGFIVCKRFG
jgi:hypothetical protein